MEFGILGPLEARDSERVISVRGRRHRVLLAALLLGGGRPVSHDRLVDALWGNQPPETASKALQVYVFELRKLLGREAIASHPGGYGLPLVSGELDAERFELLVREGRTALTAGDPRRASAALTAALALWRGDPLADVADEPFVQSEVARLEEARLAAREARIEADLALARHREVVGELEALVREHPLRERLRAQLMLALYRSGRQAGALAVYQDARRALVDELGIEPTHELQELERMILNQDARLEPARPAGGRRPASPGTFVGREREREQLVALLDDVLQGHGRLCLVAGEPGIGKSRLLEELAACALDRGACVAVGRAWEAGGAPAFWPWAQGLRSLVRELADEPATLRLQLGPGAADLAQLVPGLHELCQGLPPPAEPQASRFRLFEAVSAFLRGASAARPIVLLLDDLQAADEPSLLLLRFVARELGQSRVLVAGAYRDVGPTIHDPLATAVAEVVREPVTTRIALSGLHMRAVGRYLEESTGTGVPPELAASVHARTEGNPLFVSELVRLLVAEGGSLDVLEAPDGSVPEGIREVIDRRLRELPDRCRRLLTLASVLGREVDLPLLDRLAGTAGDELLDQLEAAREARVVVDVPGAPTRVRFAHVLIRDVLYEDLAPARRVRLHRLAGEALETVRGDLEQHLTELAYHFARAAPAGEVGKAVVYARRAGDRAAALLAFEEAARLYEVGLEALGLEQLRGDETACELLLALGDVQARVGDTPAARATFRRASELALRLARPELLGHAALGYGGRFVWGRAGSDPEVVARLEEALAELDPADSLLRARLLARLAGALRDDPSPEPRTSLAREALAIARRLGDPSTLAYALDGHCAAIWRPDNPEERLALANELVAVADRAGDRERAFQAHGHRLNALMELGDTEGAKAGMEARESIAEELRQPAQRWLVSANRAMLALFEGRLVEAEQLVEASFQLGERVQAWDAVATYRIQLFALRRAQGRLSEVEESLVRSTEDYPGYPLFRCLLAALHAELGREWEARCVFEGLAASRFEALPRDNEWLFALIHLPDVAAFLGDRASSSVLYELLEPYAGRNAVAHPEVATGSVSRGLGVLAGILGHWSAAERHFEAAIEMNRRMGAVPWVVETQLTYARMLLSRGAPGDAERAAGLVAVSRAGAVSGAAPTA